MFYAVSACKRQFTLSATETRQVSFFIENIIMGLLTLYYMKLEMHHQRTQVNCD